MTIFIQSLDYNLWDLIVDVPNLPTSRNENGEQIPKPRSSYNDEDRRTVQMNAKAKHIIICAMNSSEFNRVSSYVSAKEMWDKLEVTYEGTNQVKEAKISMIVHDYGEMVRKILRCLPRSWMPKVMAIEEEKNLNILHLEDLLGSLMTHKLSMQKKDDDEEKEKKKKKVVVLKSSTIEDSDDDDDDNEELSLITRKLKKILASKRKFGKKPNKKFHQNGELSKIKKKLFALNATSQGITRAISPD
ncbi:UBN2 domain-containing protein [Cephalotus follicularis]|uniref:UBN2 domain-containing protein n=1 Tax=Cephalotus follicularis TaxID=3775 RepID=A0A1Q3CLI5_CEPFO|nr:UBN2 domain-containing protein [Cephalotus follicularis]